VGLKEQRHGVKAVEAIGAVVLKGSGGAPVIDPGLGRAPQHRRRGATVRAAPIKEMLSGGGSHYERGENSVAVVI
jgi:hypothetical protein